MRKGRIRGEEVFGSEIEEAAEIQGEGIFPLQQVRTPARVPPQVRYLPHLFPRAGARGENPRRHEGELVAPRALTVDEREFEVMAK
jgi:hypothetical protein